MIGERISLRALEPADARLIYAWENDTTIWEVSNTLKPYSLFEIEQFILNSADIFAARQLRLMITNNDNPAEVAGMIDLFDYDPLNRRAELGILIKNAERGKGIAKEAIQLIKEYTFNTLKLHQLYAYIPIDNELSIHLFENSGFSRTGIRKEWRFINNEWTDEHLYQLIF